MAIKGQLEIDILAEMEMSSIFNGNTLVVMLYYDL